MLKHNLRIVRSNSPINARSGALLPMDSNPYAAPVEPKVDVLVRISNFNHGGGPILFALLAGAVTTIWLNLHSEGPLSEREYLYSALGAVSAIAAIGYALMVPVVWIELGSAIRFRKLLSTRRIEWQQIQSIRFTENGKLLIVIDDYHDVEVYVPDSLRERAKAVVGSNWSLGYVKKS